MISLEEKYSPEVRSVERSVDFGDAVLKAEMFSRLSLENFKTSGRREIRFVRISSIDGKSGADRAQVFDAMRVLCGIAQGKDASAFPALWVGAGWPATLSISLNTLRHGRLTYSVTLQRKEGDRVRVIEERLADRLETLLLRRRHSYTHFASKGKSGIGTTSFALFDASKILGEDDPVALFKRRLGEVWLLDPDPNAMKSEIGLGMVNAGMGDFSGFATCMVLQLGREAVATAMRSALLRLCPGLAGYAVERNEKGVPYLAVRHGSDLAPEGTPFALLDNSEKILFLAAFVCAMNLRSAPLAVFWDSPFNWLGDRERRALREMFASAFSRRGELILLV